MMIPFTATNLDASGCVTITVCTLPSLVMRDQAPRFPGLRQPPPPGRLACTALGIVLQFVRGWCPCCIGLGRNEWKSHRAACFFRDTGEPF
jgi:hypothetical protein